MSVVHPDLAATLQSQVPTAALGSRASRAVALVIDGIVVAAPFLVLSVLLGAHGAAAVVVLWLLGTLFYAPLMLARKGEHNGQTLGKQLLALRVVTTAGVPVTLGVGFKRHLLGETVPSLFTFGLYSLLDYSWPLWDANKQALHDKIAATYVFTASADPAVARQLIAPLWTPASAPAHATPPPPPPPPSGPSA